MGGVAALIAHRDAISPRPRSPGTECLEAWIRVMLAKVGLPVPLVKPNRRQHISYSYSA